MTLAESFFTSIFRDSIDHTDHHEEQGRAEERERERERETTLSTPSTDSGKTFLSL